MIEWTGSLLHRCRAALGEVREFANYSRSREKAKKTRNEAKNEAFDCTSGHESDHADTFFEVRIDHSYYPDPS